MGSLHETFIQQYKKMRAFCAENNLLCYVHGTGRSSVELEEILCDGLNVKRDHQLGCNALMIGGMKKEDINIREELETLNHYQHMDSKQFVILGVPAVCNFLYNLHEEQNKHGETEKAIENAKNKTMPLFKDFDKKPTKIMPEFLLAGLDIEKQRIVDNPDFSVEHNYAGLKFDIDSIGYNEIEFEEIFNNNLKNGLLNNNSGTYTAVNGNQYKLTKNNDGEYLLNEKEIQLDHAGKDVLIYTDKEGMRITIPLSGFIPDKKPKKVAVPPFAFDMDKQKENERGI
jgi:hypothetical protein